MSSGECRKRYLDAVKKYLTDVLLRVVKKRDTMTKTKVKGKRKAKAAPKKAARKAKPPIKTAKRSFSSDADDNRTRASAVKTAIDPDKDQRRHERTAVPVITVTVDGAVYEAVNWSFGGFLIKGYKGNLTPGSLFDITEIGTVGREMNAVDVRARVSRSNPGDKELAVTFLLLDGRAYELLHAFITERVRILNEKQGPA